MHPDFYIIDRGRHRDEAAVVKIAAGRYCGFGYISPSEAHDLTSLDNCIKPYNDNRDTRQIIQTFLKKNPRTKVIRVQSGD
jgi:DNA polymerase-3 subunit epsilon